MKTDVARTLPVIRITDLGRHNAHILCTELRALIDWLKAKWNQHYDE